MKLAEARRILRLRRRLLESSMEAVLSSTIPKRFSDMLRHLYEAEFKYSISKRADFGGHPKRREAIIRKLGRRILLLCEAIAPQIKGAFQRYLEWHLTASPSEHEETLRRTWRRYQERLQRGLRTAGGGQPIGQIGWLHLIMMEVEESFYTAAEFEALERRLDDYIQRTGMDEKGEDGAVDGAKFLANEDRRLLVGAHRQQPIASIRRAMESMEGVASGRVTDPGRAVAKVNFALNVSHAGGSMVEYVEQYTGERDLERLLDQLSATDTREWESEMAEVGFSSGVR